MAECGVAPSEVAASGAAPSSIDTSEAAFHAALVREQYRSLARLGPYVHGVVILAALAFFTATAPNRSFIGGILLPAALVAISLFRLISWFKARAGVEVETLDLVRRRVRAATILGPTLALAFTLTTVISQWQDGQVEFALALLAVWVMAAVCAICLNMLASEASVIVVAATAPVIVAFLARGVELTLWLAALIAIAACFIIRMLDENFRMFTEIVRARFEIAEKQRVAEEARQAAVAIALTDDLTGLPNRRCFHKLLADRIKKGTESHQPFALGLIDLDGFKPVNDLHGHPVGDQILAQVAERLASAMRGRGSAARIGGDEFAILCDGIGERAGVAALEREIQTLFAKPFDIRPRDVRLSCACGFALFPSSAVGPDELVRLADAALYRAKACSGGVGGANALRRAVAESESGAPFRPILEFQRGAASLGRLRA